MLSGPYEVVTLGHVRQPTLASSQPTGTATLRRLAGLAAPGTRLAPT